MSHNYEAVKGFQLVGLIHRGRRCGCIYSNNPRSAGRFIMDITEHELFLMLRLVITTTKVSSGWTPRNLLLACFCFRSLMRKIDDGSQLHYHEYDSANV